MNAEKAVRIIVKNNDQVGKIIKWYQDNKQTLDAEKFVIPFQSGSIILPGEILSFEAKQYGLIELCLQIKSGKKVLMWDYDPATGTISNHRFPANMNHVQRKKMIDVMVRENTDVIESVKYHALMKFSIHYNAVIEVKGQSLGKYGEAQEKLSGKPAALSGRTYLLMDFPEREGNVVRDKRRYHKPEYVVQVKGHFRTYKSGKKVWIEPLSRYKENGKV